MSNAIITTSNLTKTYNGVKVVNDVTLQINQGEICGLIGKNGAGKTTLMRLLAGLITPTAGTFAVCPNQQRTDTTVSALIETPSLYLNLSAMDNLKVQARLLGIQADEQYLLKTLQLVGLSRPTQRVSTFSLGMKQRLSIAMALVGKPRLVLLDEPTNGLDPQGIIDLRELFVNLNQQFGVTFVISSHILSEISKFATSYCFMHKGRLLKQVSASEVEESCKKYIKVLVADVEGAMQALEQAGHNVICKGKHLYVENNNTQIAEVVNVLSQASIEVENVQTVSQSLEDYFVALLKGERQ